jgi:hypothetical protein
MTGPSQWRFGPLRPETQPILQSEAVFAEEPVPVTARFRKEAADPCALDPWPGPCVARLASRAALISSGVLKSGSESFTFSFARAT